MKRLLRCLAALVLALMPLMYQGAPPAVLAANPYCLDANDQAFLKLINDYRRDNGLNPLVASPTLGAAAQSHNDEMAAYNYFSHTGRNGSSPAQRAQAAGYPSGYVGENIYWGSGNLGTPQAAFDGWRNSPGHNANMLRPEYAAIGIANTASSNGRTYWTNDFGDVVDATAVNCGSNPGNPGTWPTGTRNPSFAGSQATVITSTATMNSGMTIKTRDGDPASNWDSRLQPDPGQTVIVTLDLGLERTISGVKWMTAFNGYADKFTVRLMDSNYRSTTLGTFGNPGASRTWYGVGVSPTVKARWVKFYFENPRNDRVVGSIGEFAVFATDTSNNPPPPGTPRPGFAGSALPMLSVNASSNPNQAALMVDGDVASNWVSAVNPDGTVTITVDLGVERQITGVKWMTAYLGYLDAFSVSLMDSNYRSYQLGTFGNPTSSRTYFGVAVEPAVRARWVKFYLPNPNGDSRVGSISEVSVFGFGGSANFAAAAVASPQTSPQASPVASPQASPVTEQDVPAASPAVEETPVASPEIARSPATPEVIEPTTEPTATSEPTATPTEAVEDEPADASPEVNDLSQGSPEVVEPTATTEPTATETAEPTATEPVEPTATTEPTVTAEPTAAVSQGFISGTGGDPVNCRISPVDGEVIASLAEGDTVEVLGVAQDGWYAVSCAGQTGYVSAEFVTLGTPESDELVPTPTTDATATPATDGSEQDTTEPTATTAPEDVPYPVNDTGDTEQSGAAWLASDNDPGTWWSVVPSIQPDQARLYFDLGSVVPIDRLTINLATWDELPTFEIWLSEDASTWYNATPGGIDGWSLERDVDVTVSLGFDARYVRIVIPNIAGSGLNQVGGIRQVNIWPGDINQTQYVSALGAPTTPVPAPVEPTATSEPDVVEPTATTEPEDVIEPTATSEPEEGIEPTATEIVVEPPADTNPELDDGMGTPEGIANG